MTAQQKVDAFESEGSFDIEELAQVRVKMLFCLSSAGHFNLQRWRSCASNDHSYFEGMVQKGALACCMASLCKWSMMST